MQNLLFFVVPVSEKISFKLNFNRNTDRWTDRWTYIWTGRWTDFVIYMITFYMLFKNI
jgi:hypothetical protein